MEDSNREVKSKRRGRKNSITSTIIQKLESYFFGHTFSRQPEWFKSLLDKDGHEAWIDLDEIFKMDGTIPPITDDINHLLQKFARSSNIIELNETLSSIRRKSESLKVEDCGIFVDKLPKEADEAWIKEAFSNYGPILAVEIPKSTANQQHLKNNEICFVYFSNPGIIRRIIRSWRLDNSKPLLSQINLQPPQQLTKSDSKEISESQSHSIAVSSQLHNTSERYTLKRSLEAEDVDKIMYSKEMSERKNVIPVNGNQLDSSTSRILISKGAKIRKVDLETRFNDSESEKLGIINLLPCTSKRIAKDNEKVTSTEDCRTKNGQSEELKNGTSFAGDKNVRKDDQVSVDPSTKERKRRYNDSKTPDKTNAKKKAMGRTSKRSSSCSITDQARVKRQRLKSADEVNNHKRRKLVHTEDNLFSTITPASGGKKKRRKNFSRRRRYLNSRMRRQLMTQDLIICPYVDWLAMKKEYKAGQKANFAQLKAHIKYMPKINQTAQIDHLLKRGRDKLIHKAHAISQRYYEAN